MAPIAAFSLSASVEIDGARYALADYNLKWIKDQERVAKKWPSDLDVDSMSEAVTQMMTGEITEAEAKTRIGDGQKKLQQLEKWADAKILHCVPAFPGERLTGRSITRKMALAFKLHGLVVANTDMEADSRPPDSTDGTRA